MLTITEAQAKAVRRKRADLRLTKSEAHKLIGIGEKTLKSYGMVGRRLLI